MKTVIFHHKAREAIKTFPKDVRDKLGQSILDLQQGFTLGMPKSRPMPLVLKGVEELRIRGSDGTYRAFYLLKDVRGIFVFHVFMKKTQKTPPLDIALGRKRLKELLNEEE